MKFSRLWIFISLLIPVHAFSQIKLFPNWTASEYRLDLDHGGRTNAVAINPSNRNEMFAASDSGGLFMSTDGGFQWTHVDNMPAVFTQAVAYVPEHTNVVLVSAKAGFKADSGLSVWRSEDNGLHWAPPLWNGSAPPPPRLSAYEISASGENVVVGTSSGILVSTDRGVSFNRTDPFGDGSTVFSVMVTPGPSPRIYAAGPNGVRLGTIPLPPNANAWITVPNLGGIRVVHAFGRSPLSPDHAFIANGHLLFHTENRGVTWTAIASTPQPGRPCRGTPFVKAAIRSKGAAQYLELYYGDACDLHRLKVPTAAGLDFSGMWEPLEADQFSRDLALAPTLLFQTEPVLLATNGGLQNTVDRGLHWSYVGGGSGGYNALQITDVKGQYVGDEKLDLYFGTQDNNVLAFDAKKHERGHAETEGFFIDAELKVDSEDQSRITYVACNPCAPFKSNRYLQSPTHVNHSADGTAAPVFLRRGQYLQNMPHGLDLTLDPDMAVWQPFAVFLEQPVGIPLRAFAAAGDEAWVYQAFSEGASTKLMLVHHANGVGDTEHVTTPDFGSLAVNRLMEKAAYPVFDHDSQVLRIVIAADTSGNGRMLKREFFDHWTEMPGLADSLKNYNGGLLFEAALAPDPLETAPVIEPLVTAISYNPELPSHILIGTNEGGIYYSGDRGATWGRINGSEHATGVTSIFWANLNTVYVSTFGRGLWRLRNTPIVMQQTFDEFCATCNVVSNDGKERPPFDGSALVFRGRILGVRTEKSQLREIFVTPGSSVVFTGDPKDPQDDIEITESDGKDPFEPLPKPPDGWIAAGVVFATGDALVGTVFAPAELSLIPPEGKK